MVIGVVPSLLGFSLAAFAMLLAFANERFLAILTTPIPSTEKPKCSIYASTSAAFFHFILVQNVALCFALLSKSWYLPVWPPLKELLKRVGLAESALVLSTRILVWGVGFLVFVYAIAVGLAATVMIYKMSGWYEKHARISPDNKVE
jgi:hypothetical protein